MAYLTFDSSAQVKKVRLQGSPKFSLGCGFCSYAMTDESIAIVGASCQFPGAENLDEFWQLLASAGDADLRDRRPTLVDALLLPIPIAVSRARAILGLLG